MRLLNLTNKVCFNYTSFSILDNWSMFSNSNILNYLKIKFGADRSILILYDLYQEDNGENFWFSMYKGCL